MSARTVFDQILFNRGLRGESMQEFLSPDYDRRHDPFLLPDMTEAVERLEAARKAGDKITIYGDYDIDGLTATALLHEALAAFGFGSVDVFIPNRFKEGYGLTVEAVEDIASSGSKLIITVDCGSLSAIEITRAKQLGVDVIVTDHHNVAPVQPPAVAVINPKRLLAEYPDDYVDFRLVGDKKLYPFLDLAGVGVAFKLVQALQTRLDGLPAGHEKWLLDLVALGTVCDVVTLRDENRSYVYWGLKVMQKTRRPGLKALMAVSGVTTETLTARSLGFGLGPRMNAAGRLETAKHSLDLLLATDIEEAVMKASRLDDFNRTRRQDQEVILEKACLEAETYAADPVLVLSSPDWNHGIIGIVAAKLLEKYKKPIFVLQELGDISKGSARSYGDFSAADAVHYADDLIIKGGGHKLAAGVTLPTANIGQFRDRVNEFYRAQKLFNQANLLLPREDVVIEEFGVVNYELLKLFESLEPYGNGNPEPVLRTNQVLIISNRQLGAHGQHVKMTGSDKAGETMQFLAFNAPKDYFAIQPGERVNLWYHASANEWRGNLSIEGRLLHLESL